MSFAKVLILIGAILCAAYSVHAQLLQADFRRSGDAEITRDTRAGLEWLSFNVTLGKDAAYLEKRLSGDDWRVANERELCNFFEHIAYPGEFEFTCNPPPDIDTQVFWIVGANTGASHLRAVRLLKVPIEPNGNFFQQAWFVREFPVEATHGYSYIFYSEPDPADPIQGFIAHMFPRALVVEPPLPEIAWWMVREIDLDKDDDGIDDDQDNCMRVWNPTQIDSDADGFGNHCDGDFDNDDDVDGVDFLLFRSQYMSTSVSSLVQTTQASDHDCDGDTDWNDYLIFRGLFMGGTPGPSLLGMTGANVVSLGGTD